MVKINITRQRPKKEQQMEKHDRKKRTTEKNDRQKEQQKE